jgi:hypothetical protein
MQSGKIEHPQLLPVVMFPGSYWRKIIAWEAMVDSGVISAADLTLLYFTDDVVDAHNYIVDKLLQWEVASAVAAVKSAELAKHAVMSAAAAANAAAVAAVTAAKSAHVRLSDAMPGTASPLISADTIQFAKAHNSIASRGLALGPSHTTAPATHASSLLGIAVPGAAAVATPDILSGSVGIDEGTPASDM